MIPEGNMQFLCIRFSYYLSEKNLRLHKFTLFLILLSIVAIGKSTSGSTTTYFFYASKLVCRKAENIDIAFWVFRFSEKYTVFIIRFTENFLFMQVS